MTNEHEEMNRRIENGEFGSPPDLNLVNQAWANLLEKEIVNRGRKSVYHGVCSLWNDSALILLLIMRNIVDSKLTAIEVVDPAQ